MKETPLTKLRGILVQLVGCVGILIIFASTASAQHASVVRNANPIQPRALLSITVAE